MSSAEYYLENQINKFYQTLFYFIELRARGLATDQQDTYDGPLPFELVPHKVQAIAYSDNTYRDYLLDQRNYYTHCLDYSNLSFKNEFIEDKFRFQQNLMSTARVNEEDLFMLKLDIPSTSGTSITTTISTTTIKTTSTGITYGKTKKGSFCTNSNGKHFAKRLKTSLGEEWVSNCKDSSDADRTSHLITDSSLSNNCNFFNRPL